MTIDTLNTLVSGAIWRAEQLDEMDMEAGSAWMEVSKFEEALAKVLPVKEPEGRIARRGAVRAALKAKQHRRARELAEHYTAEEGVPKSLCTDLRGILESDAKALAERFPHAAKHHTPSDLQNRVIHFLEHGPFGLAA